MAANAAAISTGADHDAQALKRRNVVVEDGKYDNSPYHPPELDEKKKQVKKVRAPFVASLALMLS